MESTIELSVLKKGIHFIKRDSLTTGQQRNSMRISFNGKEWDGLTKYGVFKVDDTAKYILIVGPDIDSSDDLVAFLLGVSPTKPLFKPSPISTV